MTPEQINIAIAESLEWTKSADYQGMVFWTNATRTESVTLPPNYHGSLDACVEFEKLDSLDKATYALNLLRVTSKHLNYTPEFFHLHITFAALASLIIVTAPQRCEAYLRTINQWKGVMER